MKDGLEDFILGKPYGEHPAGTTLRVDAGRKAWLIENGYEPEPEEIAKPKRKRGSDV
jgi:hypothetical protein